MPTVCFFLPRRREWRRAINRGWFVVASAPGEFVFTKLGHSIAGRLLGLPCGGASVWPAALAEFGHDGGAASICAMMAGAAAEGALLDGTYDGVGCRKDFASAYALLKRMGYDDGAAPEAPPPGSGPRDLVASLDKGEPQQRFVTLHILP